MCCTVTVLGQEVLMPQPHARPPAAKARSDGKEVGKLRPLSLDVLTLSAICSFHFRLPQCS